MRVALLTDRLFLQRERPMLARLEVGLVDEGVRVVRLIPSALLQHASQALTSPVVGYTQPFWPIVGAVRVAPAAAAVAETLESAGEAGIDIVHCFGCRSWPIGAELASRLDAGLALEVWNRESIRRAARLHRHAREGSRPAALVPDGTTERALRRASPRLPIHVAPWGVHTPGSCRGGIDPDRPLSIAILATGRDRAALHAALDGVARIAADVPDLLVFIDAAVVHRSGLWRRARTLGLLNRLSLVENMEGAREPILHVDFIIQPESRGEHHSLTLDAMASGVLVVARADPLVEHLIDGRTAHLVGQPTPEAWTGAVTRLLAERAHAAAIRSTARAYVQQERSASGQVGAVLRAYEAILARRAPAGAAAASQPTAAGGTLPRT